MVIDVLLNKEDKLKISTAAAKSVVKHGLNLGYPLNELINEGFVRITSCMPAQAYKQARDYMLQLVNRSGIGKRVEATRKSLNPENGEMQVFVNVDKREHRVTDGITIDELIDIRDALDSLDAEDWKLIEERFVEEMTFEQMASLHDKKHSTSIKFQVDKILMKLKAFLGK